MLVPYLAGAAVAQATRNRGSGKHGLGLHELGLRRAAFSLHDTDLLTQLRGGIGHVSVVSFETLYKTMVTEDEGLVLRRTDAASCELTPLDAGDRGFASGVLVNCTSGATFRVRALDDTDRGDVSVSVNEVTPEVYHYDDDTSVLLSAEPLLAGRH